MGKKIIIAEKPSVGMEYARVLGVTSEKKRNGYLENDTWIVTWTIGHLITMSYPEKYDVSLKEWKLETLPFLPEEYRYEPIKDTHKQFDVVKKLYNRPDIETIYYAGDSGREGLYIQMLVRQFAGHNANAKEKVVWIDSQTEEEILRGISEAKDIECYASMSNAGYMRAIEDYTVGINFSRLLSVKYAPMLNSGTKQKKYKPISIGRVMTCVLGMIVGREREIRDFRSTSFFRISGLLDVDGGKVNLEWRVNDGSRYFQSSKLYSEFGFLKRSDAEEMIAGLESTMKITHIEKMVKKKYAPLLFNLAELQGECAKKFQLSPAKTLQTAQSLYEKKLITYPRTDARVLTNAIAKEIRKNLAGLEKGKYQTYVKEINAHTPKLGEKYIDDSKVTDHYAIIPTGNLPDSTLNADEQNVYDIVCRRFLAVFYPPAEYECVSIDAVCGKEIFKGTNKYLVSPGFYEVSGHPQEENSKDTVAAMSKLREQVLYPAEYEIVEGETVAPQRYTAGSIILAMECAGKMIEDEELREQIKSNGIGTSATRAEIIEKLLRLNYISIKDKNQVLVPTSFGEMVYEVVDETMPEFLVPETTAKWEKGLDQIASAQIGMEDYKKELYEYIRETCEKIKSTDSNDAIFSRIRPYASNRIQTEYQKFTSYNTKIKCPLCGDEVETTSWGFKCKSNISKTEGCQFTMGDILGHRLLTNELAELLHNGKAGPFYDFVSSKGKPFAAYLIWNKENGKVEFELADMPWNNTGLSCPICGKPIMEQNGFFRCENYSDAEHGCKFRIGRISGKQIPLKQIEKMLTDGTTDLIKGLKTKEGNKFDAFLLWDNEEKRIRFRFPDQGDLTTKYICPVCNGKILSTPYGFRCENYKPQDKRLGEDCCFVLGSIMGHTVEEKELQSIVSGGVTDPIMLKNKDKKSFKARLYWDHEQKKVALKFEDDTPAEVSANCPICGSVLKKNRYGYFCSRYSKNNDGCGFYIGRIAGVFLEEKQVIKLVTEGKTDLIEEFKPKEKGKNPFAAYLKWDKSNNKVIFDFPDATHKPSSYTCPVCNLHKLSETDYGYRCDCGFKIGKRIAEKDIPEEQLKKLFVRGETDFISGFFSKRTRRMFTAKLVLKEKQVEFLFPVNKEKEEDCADAVRKS